jgi:hypothetical protein
MKRTRRRATPSLARANKRAEALIESLLKEIQRGVDEPTILESPEWERLFGPKQSVVANVQKLVQALAALPTEAPDKANKEKDPARGAPERGGNADANGVAGSGKSRRLMDGVRRLDAADFKRCFNLLTEAGRF